ncbi:MAG TPA: cytochrome c-type biogenesis protein [Candidatus Binatia bacterium]|nr:cytochrome c-type biogenesis protein [Candidatus Binatia bacterium]
MTRLAPGVRNPCVGAVLLLAVVLGSAGVASAQPPAKPAAVSEQLVYDVASELRCVVCQNLSVADSPSEMAAQMRAIVRERLAAGESPAQVRAYFVEKYGDWILLAPPRRGFTLLVWVVPYVVALLGIALVAVLVTRWTRRRPAPPPPVDAAMRERIRREMEQEP